MSAVLQNKGDSVCTATLLHDSSTEAQQRKGREVDRRATLLAGAF